MPCPVSLQYFPFAPFRASFPSPLVMTSNLLCSGMSSSVHGFSCPPLLVHTPLPAFRAILLLPASKTLKVSLLSSGALHPPMCTPRQNPPELPCKETSIPGLRGDSPELASPSKVAAVLLSRGPVTISHPSELDGLAAIVADSPVSKA